MKKVQITDGAADVLRRSEFKAGLLILPPGQLDRKLYQEVNAVLAALGGRWDRKQGGHAMPAGAEAKLAEALGAGQAEAMAVVDKKKTLEQFFTPADVAGRMVGDLEISAGMTVLEPSAGNGRLIWEALECGARVTAIELDPDLYSELFKACARYPDLTVMCADFMALPTSDPAMTFDRVIMNPPFSKGQDMAHVRRAFSLLKPGGRLAAIMSPHWTFAINQKSAEFKRFVSLHGGTWTELPPGTFKAEGTGVNTGILTIRKPKL